MKEITSSLTLMGHLSGVALSVAWVSTISIAANAQVVVPNSLAGTSPSFAGATSSYVLNNSVSCPSPTLNVTGFGGDTDGSARTRSEPLFRGNADATNWGAAVGISIPIAGKTLREFCRKFAASQAEFQERRTRNLQQNSKIALLQQCLYIQDSLGIRISKYPEAFTGEGALAPFSECLELGSLLDISNRRPSQSLALPDPPKAPTKSATPEATPVTITQ